MPPLGYQCPGGEPQTRVQMVITIWIHGVIKNKVWRVVGWWVGSGSWKEVIVMDMSSGK